MVDEGCSELLDQRGKKKNCRDPSEMNGDNLINIRHEASRHFGNKKREYLKDKINEHEQSLNVRMVSDVKQIEIHTAEPLVPDPNPFEVEIPIAKLKRYKLQVRMKFWQN
jgi:hypothetical protein